MPAADQAVTVLLQQGGPIAALVLLGGWLVVRLHKQLSEVQEKRITDAQRVGSEMLVLAKETNEQRERIVEVLALNTKALAECTEELRRAPPKLR